MNADIGRSGWRRFRVQVKQWWEELTDDEAELIDDVYNRLVGLLQVKYGYARETAEEKIARRLQDYTSKARNQRKKARQAFMSDEN